MVHRRLILLLVITVTSGGCGQGSYEKLMKQQISTLGTWRQIVADNIGFAVKLPDGADRKADPEDYTSSDTMMIEQPWQSFFFRVNARKTNDNIDLNSEASTLEQHYVGQGYTLDNQSSGKIGYVTTVDLEFSKEDADPMVIRVAQAGSAVVQLTITSPQMDNLVRAQFFDSIEILTSGGRRR